MLKEEKAVKDWGDAAGVDRKHFLREVSALIRAVRADEREKCAEVVEKYNPARESDNCSTFAKHGIAVAIREVREERKGR